jgi:hypothetical protein
VAWLQRALHLTPAQWRALAVALADLLHVELLLRTRSLPLICSRLGIELLTRGQLPELPPTTLAVPQTWAVAALCRRGTGSAACLRYALVMGKRLARSEPVRLVIGVRRDASNHEAHAWLETSQGRWDLQRDRARALSFQPLRLSG